MMNDTMPETKKFVYLRNLVPVVEKILILQTSVDASEVAITAAEAELAATPVGYKQTIARCRIREVETTRDVTLDEMTNLIESIPAPSELLGSFYVQHIVELRIERSGIQAKIDKNAALLDAELVALKSGPWRPKGAHMPSSILRLQAIENDLHTKVGTIGRKIIELAREMDEIDTLTRNSEEVHRWLSEPDAPTPKWVVERQLREHEEFMRDCIVLKINRPVLAVVA